MLRQVQWVQSYRRYSIPHLLQRIQLWASLTGLWNFLKSGSFDFSTMRNTPLSLRSAISEYWTSLIACLFWIQYSYGMPHVIRIGKLRAFSTLTRAFDFQAKKVIPCWISLRVFVRRAHLVLKASFSFDRASWSVLVGHFHKQEAIREEMSALQHMRYWEIVHAFCTYGVARARKKNSGLLWPLRTLFYVCHEIRPALLSHQLCSASHPASPLLTSLRIFKRRKTRWNESKKKKKNTSYLNWNSLKTCR